MENWRKGNCSVTRPPWAALKNKKRQLEAPKQSAMAMNPKDIYAEQAQKEAYHMFSFICGNKKDDLTEVQSRPVTTRGWGEEEVGRCWLTDTK